MKVPLHPGIVGALAWALLGAVALAQTIVLTPNTTQLSSAGGNVTFTATISYGATPSTLGFSVTLPTGWQYLGGTSIPGTSPAEPVITPVVGRVGTLDWAFVTPPANGATFTFTASYPASSLGNPLLTSNAVTRDGTGGTPTTVTGPTLTLPAATSFITWNGGTGNWGDAAQWTPNTVPGNAGTSHFTATVAAGVATLGSAITIDNLHFTGGTINGTSPLTLTGLASTWTSGVFAGLGEIIVAPGAVFSASGNAAHSFSERTIRNQGTFVWSVRGALQSGSGGQFINSAGATFVDATTGIADYLITNTSGGTFTFTNAGTFSKSTTSSTHVTVPFSNTGNVLVTAGTLRFSNTFTQSSGIVFVNTGATLKFDQGLTISGGTVHGSGTIVAHISNSAFLSPGSLIGTLTVQGNLTLLGSSQLLFDLSTPVPGTGHDFLNVTGTVALGGTFNFNMVGAGATSAFSAGDSLTLLNSSGLTGTFLNLPGGTRIFASHGVGSFVLNYTSTGVVLNQFLPVPEPSTWALMFTGLGVIAWATLRRRRQAYRSSVVPPSIS